MAKNQSYAFDKIEDAFSSNESVSRRRDRRDEADDEGSSVEIGVTGIVLLVLAVILLCFATGFIVYFLRPDAQKCAVTSAGDGSGNDGNSSATDSTTRKCFLS